MVVTGEMDSTRLKYGMTADQLFEKKKECAGYKTSMENDAKKYYWENYKRVSEIFYSPQVNSCLYVVLYYPNQSTVTKDIAYKLPYEVFDFFTKKPLWSATADFIKELKGE